MNDIDAVSFDDALRSRLDELIRNKQAASRNKDLDDVYYLKAAREKM